MKKIFWLLPILILTACTQDFEDINTNENAPSDIQPEFLLRQVIYGYGDAMSYEGFVAGNLLSQHFAMIDFNGFDRHALSSPQEGGNPWPILYTSLRDNETILNISRENPAFAVYEGPAMVMKAYLAMTLTDLFGDVPYFEAFRGRSSGITTPAYDSQEDIYASLDGGIVNLLSSAVTVMEGYNGVQRLEGDILYDGDLSAWIKFSRSLLLKAYVRVSAADFNGGALGGGPVERFFDNAFREEELISENSENAVFNFAPGPPNDYPLARARIGIFNVFLMSETAATVFNDLNDPRIEVLYRASAANGDFRGIANGIDPASSIVPDNFARPGRVFRENSADFQFNFLTAWEVNFMIAEQLVTYADTTIVSPKIYYERGVRQAFDYWNVEMPEDYLTTGSAAYDPSRSLEQIMTQKWIANIGNAYDSWADWRRTGFPAAIRPAEASLNNGLFPRRMPYPNDEQALNFENYQTAAEATDGNSINVPVAWDVE